MTAALDRTSEKVPASERYSYRSFGQARLSGSCIICGVDCSVLQIRIDRFRGLVVSIRCCRDFMNWVEQNSRCRSIYGAGFNDGI